MWKIGAASFLGLSALAFQQTMQTWITVATVLIPVIGATIILAIREVQAIQRAMQTQQTAMQTQQKAMQTQQEVSLVSQRAILDKIRELISEDAKP